MKKVKINDNCSIRVNGPLYCLTDLYRFMDMRNARSAPENWAADRAGMLLVKKGFFRKTYWGTSPTLVNYAESLTPGIAKEVRIAMGVPKIPSTQEVVKKMQETRPAAPLRIAKEDLFVAPEIPVRDQEMERLIRQAQQRAQTKRSNPPRPTPRGTRSVSTRGTSSSRHDDSMVMQAVLMNDILSQPSRSHHSSIGSCSRDDSPSYSHSHSHSHSHDSYSSSSYDSGSSSYDSGSSGCD